MRMWMIDPVYMCRKHLLGEHNELHKFIPHFKNRGKIDGYIKNNCIEPKSYKARHDKLVMEMERRGYNHKTPIEQPDFSYLPKSQQNHKVNIKNNTKLLFDRCNDCVDRAGLLFGSIFKT